MGKCLPLQSAPSKVVVTPPVHTAYQRAPCLWTVLGLRAAEGHLSSGTCCPVVVGAWEFLCDHTSTVLWMLRNVSLYNVCSAGVGLVFQRFCGTPKRSSLVLPGSFVEKTNDFPHQGLFPRPSLLCSITWVFFPSRLLTINHSWSQSSQTFPGNVCSQSGQQSPVPCQAPFSIRLLILPAVAVLGIYACYRFVCVEGKVEQVAQVKHRGLHDAVRGRQDDAWLACAEKPVRQTWTGSRGQTESWREGGAVVRTGVTWSSEKRLPVTGERCLIDTGYISASGLHDNGPIIIPTEDQEAAN